MIDWLQLEVMGKLVLYIILALTIAESLFDIGRGLVAIAIRLWV